MATAHLSRADLRRLSPATRGRLQVTIDELADLDRPSKYGSRKQTVDGITFDSRREATRYSVLRLEERAGRIRDLELQQPYAIYVPKFSQGSTRDVVAVVLVAAWRSDFRYIRNGVTVIEDAKGFRNRLYRLKKKCVEAQYGITITEV